MNYIGKFISNFKDFYNDINAATLTGAIDVVVVRQLDGTYLSSPFHVRFGKIGVLRSREKVVDIEINGEPVDIHMKLGDNGEAYFVHPRGEDVELQEELNMAEARSQDSGYEAEEKGENVAAQSLTLRINVDEKMLSMVSDEQVSDLGVVSRVPRQDSTKSVRRDIMTQTAQLPTDKDSSSADEVPSKVSKKSSGDKKSESLENKQKTDVEETSKSSRSQKRKRRKQRKNNSSASSLPPPTQSLSVSKSFGKKKSSGSQSSDASTTSEVADFTSLNSSKDDGVFPMDDVNKLSTVTSDIPQSNSMPTLAEKPVPVMRPSQSDGSVVGERRWGERGGEENTTANHKEYGINFHPFSDTDISPPPSPNNSRPSTPIKSDTEYEVDRERREGEGRRGREWDWTWGQLPTPPVVKHKGQSSGAISSDGGNEAATEGTEAAAKEGTASVAESQSGGNTVSNDMQGEEAERSMFSGVLSFMRATKKARHNPKAEGIYLEDLNPADLNPEVAALYFPKYSGAQKSVNSVDIPSGGVVSKEDDLESGNGTSLPNSPQSAGEAIGASIDLDGEAERHPVFDYKGYHDIAFSLCGRLKECADQEFPEPLFLQNLVTYDDFCDNPSAILSNPDLVVRMGGKYLNWGSAAPHILSLVLFQRPLASTVSDNLVQMMMPRKSEGSERKRTSSRGLSWLWGRRGPEEGEVVEEKKEVVEEEPEKELQETEDKDTVEVCAAETQTSLQEASDTEAGKKDSDDLRSLRLTTKQIEQLKLRDGANDIVFSVTTAYQGTTRCKCRLFLWNYDEKIIVSDIDGTITKSDVLGHIMPIIGNDWAQGGVAQLFTKIKNNGYNFLYLSARAIGQAHITREYLQSVVQGDMSLPDGPMLLNPSSLFQAFHSEVIERKSEEFKKSCLLDIQALYPSESNPFYAGYGNRINDVLAYKTVGIPMSRVFTINHKGEVRHEMTQTFQSSYTSLTDIAHHMFPVYSQESLNHGEYSSVRFWKSPLPDYDDEINKLLGEAAGK